jgi:[histone H3]-lysine4 N-trimethyltransferase ATXR3
VLADISAILRSVNSINVAVPAFCDILMLYARTETYFTQNDCYKKSKSDTVIIRNCDVRHGDNAKMDKFSQGELAYSGCKEYDSQYIWGQLIMWFKQTVDKPNASLSADRRGTLSIPDVHSFIVSPSKA